MNLAPQKMLDYLLNPWQVAYQQVRNGKLIAPRKAIIDFISDLCGMDIR